MIPTGPKKRRGFIGGALALAAVLRLAVAVLAQAGPAFANGVGMEFLRVSARSFQVVLGLYSLLEEPIRAKYARRDKLEHFEGLDLVKDRRLETAAARAKKTAGKAQVATAVKGRFPASVSREIRPPQTPDGS